MSVRYRRDKSGELKKLADKIINTEGEYAPLKNLKILFVWREGKPKPDEDGGVVGATASVLATRHRDLFGFDCQIEVSHDIWVTLNMVWKKRLMWHELRHFEVEQVENDSGKLVPDRDRENRIRISTVPHDISLRTFKAEIEKFGVDVSEVTTFRFISRKYIEAKKNKVKKYSRPKALRPDEEEEEAEAVQAPRTRKKKRVKKVRTKKKASIRKAAKVILGQG